MNYSRYTECALCVGLVICICAFTYNHANIDSNKIFSDKQKEDAGQIPETFPSLLQSISASGVTGVITNTVTIQTNPAADSILIDLGILNYRPDSAFTKKI